MRIKNKRGYYVTMQRDNNILFEKGAKITDAFCFENPKEISKERFKKYMKEIKT